MLTGGSMQRGLYWEPGNDFGQFIERILTEIRPKLRQKDLAELAGVKASNLSKIMNGGSPSWEVAAAIMRALNVRLVWSPSGAGEEAGQSLRQFEMVMDPAVLYRSGEADSSKKGKDGKP